MSTCLVGALTLFTEFLFLPFAFHDLKAAETKLEIMKIKRPQQPSSAKHRMHFAASPRDSSGPSYKVGSEVGTRADLAFAT